MVTGKPSSIVTSAEQPCASAIAGARRFSSRATIARRSGESVRIVPSISAVSGMILFVVPAALFAIVTTAGSKNEMGRGTIGWLAVTLAQRSEESREGKGVAVRVDHGG